MICVDISNVWGQIALPDLLAIENEVADAHEKLVNGTGEGSGHRQWLNLPAREDDPEMIRILKAAEQIRANSDVCVVTGIGGSCLGARAAMELLQGPNRNIGRGDPQIFFAGNSLSTRSWNELMGLLRDKDFSVIAVSRSGVTTEPAIAFRSLRWMLERKYGTDAANRRIYAVTDPVSGGLRQMAEEKGWTSFSIPRHMGNSFSVLSPAGLLPLAVAGIPVEQMLRGAMEARETYDLRSFENPAWQYVAVRNVLYRNGKTVELLESFEPGFGRMGHWWQQMFGASEGKDGKGLFPATAELPADLHALGQLIQQGERNLFETVIRFDPPEHTVTIGSDWKDLDGLNYLEGKNLDFVEEQAYQGTVAAHTDGGVPVIAVDCGILDAQTVGELLYFLELCCGVSAWVLGVDPFERPGVEYYKQNMRQLLGNSGI